MARVVVSDYACWMCASIPPVFWLFFGLTSIPGPGGLANMFLVFALATTVFCVPILWWRARRIRRLFRVGIPVPGRVVRVWRTPAPILHAGNVSYTYEYGSINYQGRAAFMPTRQTDTLAPGLDVTVLVDADSPSRSVLPAIYG